MIRISVVEESHVADAVEITRSRMDAWGFPLAKQCMIATAVSELATNVFIHAGQGVITIAQLKGSNNTGIEIIAEDSGPGIPDIETAMIEGYSTAGSLGVGLPGTKRLADEFSIQSTVGQGTRAIIRAWLV